MVTLLTQLWSPLLHFPRTPKPQNVSDTTRGLPENSRVDP